MEVSKAHCDLSTKKLIWFQHMHKSAGSTIIKIADENRVNFYQPNYNGNPRYTKHEPGAIENWNEYHTDEIRYDRFSKLRLQSFIDVCINSKVQLICCEWGFPKEPILDPRILYMTCIRHPWSRFISNYSFDFNENPDINTIDDWIESPKPQYVFTRNNYYTFILSGLNYKYTGPVTREHYELAIRNLKKFDLVLLLEDPNCFEVLSLYLGWHYKPRTRVNVTNNKVKLPGYRKLFEVDNQYDLMLYDQVCWMAKTRSASYAEIFNISWYQKLNRSADIDIHVCIFNAAREVEQNGEKEQAVEMQLYSLSRINSAKLRYISPKLLDIVDTHNKTEIVNVYEASQWVINTIHHLSYVCYYTRYKHIGKMMCEILLETPVPHVYHEHVKSTLKWYL